MLSGVVFEQIGRLLQEMSLSVETAQQLEELEAT